MILLKGSLTTKLSISVLNTASKVPKYGVFSGPYFPSFGLNTSYLSVFSPNAGKYGPEKTPYLDTFYAVKDITNNVNLLNNVKKIFRKVSKDSIYTTSIFFDNR